ncbi:Uncharacterized protein SCF082_LOCUS28888, partial [Durusdinium trenchii]
QVTRRSPMLLLATRKPSEQLAPLVAFLRHQVGIDPAAERCLAFYAWPDAVEMLQRAAQHLTELGYSMEELRENVDALGYSFEARLLPRSRFLQHLGVAGDSVAGVASRCPLRILAIADDLKFCQFLGVTQKDFLSFMFDLRRSLRQKMSRIRTGWTDMHDGFRMHQLRRGLRELHGIPLL